MKCHLTPSIVTPGCYLPFNLPSFFLSQPGLVQVGGCGGRQAASKQAGEAFRKKTKATGNHEEIIRQTDRPRRHVLLRFR